MKKWFRKFLIEKCSNMLWSLSDAASWGYDEAKDIFEECPEQFKNETVLSKHFHFINSKNEKQLRKYLDEN